MPKLPNQDSSFWKKPVRCNFDIACYSSRFYVFEDNVTKPEDSRGREKFSKIHYPINIPLELNIIVLIKHCCLIYDSCVLWNSEKNSCCKKHKNIDFQVFKFSTYRMDLFFRQLRVAIRRVNIHLHVLKLYMGKGPVALKAQIFDPVWYCVH